MRVAVIQPSYAPWLGYLSMMRDADVFIYYDDVQYDKNGWRNRNRVMVNDKIKWLTLSIDKASLGASLKGRSLMNVKLIDNMQFIGHKRLLETYYNSSRHIRLLDTLYPESMNSTIMLADSVIAHTECIVKLLRIETKRLRSSNFESYSSSDLFDDAMTPIEKKNRRLLSLLNKAGCTEYVSGEAARAYINEDLFMEHGISVVWNPYHGDGINLSVVHYLLERGPTDVVELLSNPRLKSD